MNRHTLTVQVDGYRSLVSGWGAAGLVRKVTGRHPMWVSRLRGYSVSETTAAEVIALAQSEGIPVLLAHPPHRPVTDAGSEEEKVAEPAVVEAVEEAEVGLW